MHVGVAWDYYDGNQDQVLQKKLESFMFLELTSHVTYNATVDDFIDYCDFIVFIVVNIIPSI